MAGAFALRCVRAPINAVSATMGLSGAVCSSALYRTVQISEELTGLEALAPGANPGSVILYFHGGGHWLLNVQTYREFIGRLSVATGARVVAVAYRKPPQVRFPEGLEDALAAWRWARETHPASAIAVAGDSSGGNLTFALVVKLAQLKEPQPAACVGISPWLRLDIKSHKPEDLYGKFCVDLYLGGKQKVTTPDDPLVSPVNADPELVRRFPPVLMHAGRNELTTEDVKEMAAACERQGMPVEVQLYAAPHIFQVGPGFPASTRDSLSRISAFLHKHWQ